MTRPVQFNHDEVIEATLQAFWTRGVHRCSIDDLVAASGLSRSSLYNSFGSKQGLYERALQRYIDQHADNFSSTLAQPSLKAALGDLVTNIVADNFAGRGCLLVNGASGLIPGEAVDQNMLRVGFNRVFAVLERRISDAQASGEMTTRIDAESAAMMVCAMLSGLCVLHKAGFGEQKMESAANMAFEYLYAQFQ